MSYLDDLEQDAMVCAGCERIVTQEEIDREWFTRGEDPETFDNLYFHTRCFPVPFEKIEDNERWWPR